MTLPLIENVTVREYWSDGNDHFIATEAAQPIRSLLEESSVEKFPLQGNQRFRWTSNLGTFEHIQYELSFCYDALYILIAEYDRDGRSPGGVWECWDVSIRRSALSYTFKVIRATSTDNGKANIIQEV